MTAAIPRSVEIVPDAEKWIVRVTEDASVSHATEFELESFAVSYAEGQRIRLGVPAITRFDAHTGGA